MPNFFSFPFAYAISLSLLSSCTSCFLLSFRLQTPSFLPSIGLSPSSSITPFVLVPPLMPSFLIIIPLFIMSSRVRPCLCRTLFLDSFLCDVGLECVDGALIAATWKERKIVGKRQIQMYMLLTLNGENEFRPR